jgi:hypothetical protein
MNSCLGSVAAVTLLLVTGAPSMAQTRADGSETPLDGKTEKSLQEVSRQVHNPIGPLWQLTFDHSILGLGGAGLDGVGPAYTGSFEPQGPVWLGRPDMKRFRWAQGLGFFARLTSPFIETVPVPPGISGDDRRSGIGDIQLGGVVGPKRLSGSAFGVGPTFIFPSASDDALGQGKWQAGPAVVAGYVGKDWTASVTAQQWWSFAGDDSRPDTNQLNLNYVLIRSLPGRWQIGMQPTLTVDWTASSGNAVSFPIGLGVGRTIRMGKLPIQLWLEADYYAVRPDDLSGPRWGIDLQIAPVIPRPFP